MIPEDNICARALVIALCTIVTPSCYKSMEIWDEPTSEADSESDTGSELDTESESDTGSELDTDADGKYMWHTFFGGNSIDAANSISVDKAGNIYIAGRYEGYWEGPEGEPPLNDAGGNMSRLFVLKLDPNAEYMWHTFYGGETVGKSVVVDEAGNVFVTGFSNGNWTGPGGEGPLNEYTGSDIFVLKLGTNGEYQWHTFYGIPFGSGGSCGYAILLDESGDIIVAGFSSAYTAGPGGEIPLNPPSGHADIVVLKLGGNGAYKWHTYYGCEETNNMAGQSDTAYGIALDEMDNIIVSGYSLKSWDGPDGQSALNAHSGAYNVVVLKLDSGGQYIWHTFYGASGYDLYTNPHFDTNDSLVVDENGDIILTGASYPWDGPNGQAPLNAHPGNHSTFILRLNSSGEYQWHTFFGTIDNSYWNVCSLNGVTMDEAGNIFVTNVAEEEWSGPDGEPPLAPLSGDDIFVLKLDPDGKYQWHSFYGAEFSTSMTTTLDGNFLVTGFSRDWSGPGGQAPLNPHSGEFDIFVLQLED